MSEFGEPRHVARNANTVATSAARDRRQRLGTKVKLWKKRHDGSRRSSGEHDKSTRNEGETSDPSGGV